MTSKQSQELLNQAQLYQQQIQGIAIQKETFSMQLIEITKALDELEKSKGDGLYKVSGPILIKSEKGELKKELEEKKELISVKLKTLEKSEQRIKERIDGLKEKLTKAEA